MTYEEWAKEIAAAPMLFDGSSKHVYSRIFADWTNERRTAEAERDKLRDLLREARDATSIALEKCPFPVGAQRAKRMLEVVVACTRAALEKPYVDPLDGTRAVDAEGNRL